MSPIEHDAAASYEITHEREFAKAIVIHYAEGSRRLSLPAELTGFNVGYSWVTGIELLASWTFPEQLPIAEKHQAVIRQRIEAWGRRTGMSVGFERPVYLDEVFLRMQAAGYESFTQDDGTVVWKRPRGESHRSPNLGSLLMSIFSRKQPDLFGDTPFHDIPVDAADGSKQTLAPYKGKALLIVNVASQCGFTPQYEGLEALHRRLASGGRFEVIGFPCNQFGEQEPGNADEIATFCKLTYDVTFPVMGKIDVNGAGTAPIYRYLKSERPGLLGTEAIKWNFTKFLVDADGKVIKRYAPNDLPEDIGRDVDALLTKT